MFILHILLRFFKVISDQNFVFREETKLTVNFPQQKNLKRRKAFWALKGFKRRRGHSRGFPTLTKDLLICLKYLPVKVTQEKTQRKTQVYWNCFTSIYLWNWTHWINENLLGYSYFKHNSFRIIIKSYFLFYRFLLKTQTRGPGIWFLGKSPTNCIALSDSRRKLHSPKCNRCKYLRWRGIRGRGRKLGSQPKNPRWRRGPSKRGPNAKSTRRI